MMHRNRAGRVAPLRQAHLIFADTACSRWEERQICKPVIRSNQAQRHEHTQELISLTHSHPAPPPFSFQSVTLPSPPLTASTLPARLHETRQTTSGNVSPSPGSSGVVVQGVEGDARV